MDGSVVINDSNYYITEVSLLALDIELQGKRKEISKMFEKDSFIEWDFDEIWTIEEGKTIPYLKNLDKPSEVDEKYVYEKGLFSKEISEDEQSITISYSNKKEIKDATIDGEKLEIIRDGDNYRFFKNLIEAKEYEIVVTTADEEIKTIRYAPEELLRTGEEVSIFKNLENATVNGTSLYEYGFTVNWGNAEAGYKTFGQSNIRSGHGSGQTSWSSSINWDYTKEYQNIIADELEINATLIAGNKTYYGKPRRSNATLSVTVNFVDGTSITESTPTNNGEGTKNETINLQLDNKKISNITFSLSGYDHDGSDSSINIEGIILKNAKLSK